MRSALSLVILTGAVLLPLSAQTTAPPPIAVKVLSLFDQLRAASKTPESVSFHLTEKEVNDYLQYALKASSRPGLESTTIKLSK